MRIEGTIVGTFSEQVNGAPVVVSIQQDDNTHHSFTFDRRCWNEFVDGNSPMFLGRTRVVVEGESEHDCIIRVAEDEPFEELLRARMGA